MTVVLAATNKTVGMAPMPPQQSHRRKLLQTDLSSLFNIPVTIPAGTPSGLQVCLSPASTVPTSGEVELSTSLLALLFFDKVNPMTRITYSEVAVTAYRCNALLCISCELFSTRSHVFTCAVLIIILSLDCGLQQI